MRILRRIVGVHRTEQSAGIKAGAFASDIIIYDSSSFPKFKISLIHCKIETCTTIVFRKTKTDGLHRYISIAVQFACFPFCL